MKLGIIGTNWITAQFVEANKIAASATLTAVYSRTAAKAEQFVESVQGQDVAIFTDLAEFFASAAFDTVYIASPNSLHFAQAKLALEHDKNVIVEKPAFATRAQFTEITETLAAHPQAFFFEAARHLYDPNFRVASAQIKKMTALNGATISYMKYSSRYDNVLNGEEPNIFSPKFAGGALQDLGVYTVYAAVKWFGLPTQANYFPDMIRTGVDGKGTAILEYPEFKVTLLFGKTANSYIPTEVYDQKETLWIDNIGTMDQVKLYDAKGQATNLTVAHPKNPMVDEARAFAKMINEQDYAQMRELFSLAEQVNQTVYALRQSAKIKFAQDED